MADKRIDQLTAATSLTAVDLMVTEQSGVAKKVTGDILANSAWNMMQKDASPTKDSTAPVTSGAVYDALGGVFSPTKLATPGALVHIEDGGYNQPIQGMRIAISPVQSGEGDPSPENVRPISGWTSAKITRTGSNLISPFDGYGTNENKGIVTTFNNEFVSITGTSTGGNTNSLNMLLASPLTLSAGETYVFAINGNWSTPNLRLRLRDESSDLWYVDSRNCVWIVTPETDLTITRVAFRVTASGSVIDVSGAFYCNLGDLEAYEPYKGTTYEVSFSSAGTVYGGTLTYNGDGTWTLAVEWVILNPSSVTWRYYSTQNYWYASFSGFPIAPFVPSAGTISTVISSRYKTETVTTSTGTHAGKDGIVWYHGSPANQIAIKDTSITATTEAEFKEAISDVQLVIKIASPQTYTLTGPEVLTRLGINNLWADCGEIEELAYRADIGLYLVEALNPIKEMLAYREDTMTATRAYTTGDFIVVGDTFYKAATAIANGATLTPGTNVNATTVGAQLKLLS